MHPETVGDVDRAVHGGSDDPSVVDFSANTNPERPPGVARVYEAALGAARRYPSDRYSRFRRAAGEYLGVAPDRVVPTAGGLEALRLAFAVGVEPGDTALVPAPGFAEYEREIRLQGGEPVHVPDDALTETDPADHAVAVVCNPNNPTGLAYGAADLRRFAERCRAADTVLVVDEAYLDFGETATMAGEPGVVAVRSLTKLFGLPGLRIGFAVATGPLYDLLERARPAWGLSTPAAQVGCYCLDQEAFVERTRERVVTERERMAAALEGRFDVHPSEANFLLLDAGDRDVDGVIDRAREAGLVVRDARTFRGLDSHVRVSVRRPAENDRLLAVLADGP
jgi:L-threonine-O-3-phosphate decarboxylase